MVDFDDDSVEIEETTEYQKKEVTIKDIILNHIRAISKICTEEMTAGFWQEKPVKTGSGIFLAKQYKPDRRLSYSVAVDFLSDTVIAMIDEKLKDKLVQQYVKDNQKDYKAEERYKDKREIYRHIMFALMDLGFFGTEEARTVHVSASKG